MVADWEDDEIENVEETLRAYQRAIRHGEDLNACEKGDQKVVGRAQT